MLRQMIVLSMILVFCCASVQASEVRSMQAEAFGAEELEKSVPDDVIDVLDGIGPTNAGNVSQVMQRILEKAAKSMIESVYSGVSIMVRLLFTIIVCQMVDPLCAGKGKMTVQYGGVLALSAACLSELRIMVGLGEETMERLSGFVMALNPVMAAAAAAAGASAGAGLNYMLTVFFSNLLIRVCTGLIIPVVFCYLVLALADILLGEEKLKHLREFLGWGIELMLKGVVYGFLCCLTLTGVLAGTVDSVKLKATKSAISAMIPVVGGIISGAAQTVLAGAEFLKGTVGTYGMVVIVAIFLFPFIKLSVNWLVLKITSVLSSLLSSPLTGVLDAVSKAMGYLLAMTGSSALICLLSCCCYLKVVQI